MTVYGNFEKPLIAGDAAAIVNGHEHPHRMLPLAYVGLPGLSCGSKPLSSDGIASLKPRLDLIKVHQLPIPL